MVHPQGGSAPTSWSPTSSRSSHRQRSQPGATSEPMSVNTHAFADIDDDINMDQASPSAHAMVDGPMTTPLCPISSSTTSSSSSSSRCGQPGRGSCSTTAQPTTRTPCTATVPSSSVPIAKTNTTTTISTAPSTTQQQRSFTILHPALAPTSTPAITTPTIYALAPAVPIPLVDQLTVNSTNTSAKQQEKSGPNANVNASVNANTKAGPSPAEPSPVTSTAAILTEADRARLHLHTPIQAQTQLHAHAKRSLTRPGLSPASIAVATPGGPTLPASTFTVNHNANEKTATEAAEPTAGRIIPPAEPTATAKKTLNPTSIPATFASSLLHSSSSFSDPPDPSPRPPPFSPPLPRGQPAQHLSLTTPTTNPVSGSLPSVYPGEPTGDLDNAEAPATSAEAGAAARFATPITPTTSATQTAQGRLAPLFFAMDETSSSATGFFSDQSMDSDSAPATEDDVHPYFAASNLNERERPRLLSQTGRAFIPGVGGHGTYAAALGLSSSGIGPTSGNSGRVSSDPTTRAGPEAVHSHHQRHYHQHHHHHHPHHHHSNHHGQHDDGDKNIDTSKESVQIPILKNNDSGSSKVEEEHGLKAAFGLESTIGNPGAEAEPPNAGTGSGAGSARPKRPTLARSRSSVLGRAHLGRAQGRGEKGLDESEGHDTYMGGRSTSEIPPASVQPAETGGSSSGSRNRRGVNPLSRMSIPHVRAGISPALNLDTSVATADQDGVYEIAGMMEQQEADQSLETQEEAPPEVEESVESLIESMDWSMTRMGPRSSWPMELTLWMPVLMKSASPLAIYWGDQSCLIYNDAWRPILKQKHPQAMGAPGATVWSEIWDVLGAQMAQVRREGRGSDNKGLRLDLHREGYEEECYFDFTFTPIFLQDGSVGGILAIVQEVTQSILSQRRLTTLHMFSKQAPLIQSVTGAYSMITTILQESNNLDVPFSILYKTKEVAKDQGGTSTMGPLAHGAFSPQLTHNSGNNSSNENSDGSRNNGKGALLGGYEDPQSSVPSKVAARRTPQSAILCSTSFDRNLEVVDYGEHIKERVFAKSLSTRHIPDSLLITPEEYEPLDPSQPVHDDPWAWPVRSVLADGRPRVVTLPKSTHKLARALLLPILENPSVLDSRITTILIVGINPYQLLDNKYLDFLALLAANIASLLHFGRSREEERNSAEALFELNKAKISFFQNISHELRTPLTLMLAPLEDVLGQTPEKAPTRSSLEMIRRNSRRLLKLVNTLLQFSRIEAGKGLAIFEETDLTKATNEISANFESVARGFNLDYIINCEDLSGIPSGFWVDRAMWGGIILNLIGNAFKHTWEGSVTVHQYPCKGKEGKEGVAVDVKDTGVGISAEHLPTLFGRFNRIENKQSRSHEGTGIGLSLVRELTEVHGGTVSVTSVVDKGTCFHLWIPAGRGHHPSSQVKLGDSDEASAEELKAQKHALMNNKTDASMFVEEASQWISQKALPGSTINASGTDSTEEDKAEDDDDVLQPGLEYYRGGRQDLPIAQTLAEFNKDFEVSAMNIEEGELSKLLLDPADVEDHFHLPENSIGMIESSFTPRRSSASTVHSPKMKSIEPPSSTSAAAGSSYSGRGPNGEAEAVSPSQPGGNDPNFDHGINDDGGYRDRVQMDDDAADDDRSLLPKTKSRRSYIIIVDDNNDMRAYLREILGKDFRVRCAVDGLHAIRLISERLMQGKRIDLVLSDVAMPNMNGYELLKRLRSDPVTMMTPFILLSARAGEEANVEGLDLGADDCLVKPFSARELLARVRSTIRLSDLRHELIREQRHALEMKKLIYSISVRIRSGLSLPQILDTASKELFKVIRCNAIRIGRFRRVDAETGQHWVRFVSEIVRMGKPKILSHADRLLPKGLEVILSDQGLLLTTNGGANNGGSEQHHDVSGDVQHLSNYQHPVYGAKSFISVALLYNRKVWGYLLASRDADMVDWSQSEKLLFEQTGNQISLAIAHASLWELKKSQQVEMETAHAANEAKSQILANTSHELRTPIGAIVGALSALEDTDHNLTGEQKDMVKIMQITSDVALSVINDLLDTAKLEAGAMSLNIKACPELVETLEQSVRIFADKAGRKEVDLIMEPSEELEALETSLQQGTVIWTDGDRLQQVIMNLIGNAVKFTANGKVVIQCSIVEEGKDTAFGPGISSPSGSAVSASPVNPGSEFEHVQQTPYGLHPLHYQQSPQHPKVHYPVPIPPDAQVRHLTFRFEVSDTGIGIDPEFLKNHIFKSFAQFDQSMTRRFGGTGLGLAISKRLVKMNGGFLDVSSNVGEGSTFYFTWPFTLVLPVADISGPLFNRHKQLAPRPILSPEIAAETRAVVVEPVSEARHMLGWVLHQQSVHSTLYENCESVIEDERKRDPDLHGPNGTVLTRNYRPNAHFFFCVRSSTVEATIETARALGGLFKERNEQARRSGDVEYKEGMLSIVLVIFSSHQGRLLAKDMMKRIRAHGLEHTIQCRYVVKPVKLERVIECLQNLGSYAPYTRNQPADGREATTSPSPGSLKHGRQHSSSHIHYHGNRPHGRRQRTGHSESPTDTSSIFHNPYATSQVIPANGSVSMITGDYEKDNDCNKNTPESLAMDPDGLMLSRHPPFTSSPILSSHSGSSDAGGDSSTAPSPNPMASLVNRSGTTTPVLRSLTPSSMTPLALGMKNGMGMITSGPSSTASIPNGGSPPLFSPCRLSPTIASISSVIGCIPPNPAKQKSPAPGTPPVVARRKLKSSNTGTSTKTGSRDVAAKMQGDNNAFSNRSARAAAGKRERRGKCVLCVEDNIINLRVVQYQLQKLGYDTQSACDGQVAVDLIKEQINMLGEHQTSGEDTQSTNDPEGSNVSQTTRGGGGGAGSDTDVNMASADELEPTRPGGPSSAVKAPGGVAAILAMTPTEPTAPYPPVSSPGSVSATEDSTRQHPPPKIDLILMDCAMPIKSGFDAAIEIRAMGATSRFAANIPIIALTASAVPSTKDKCLASGMNGYLSKPTKLGDLEAMLDQWIE